MKLNISTIKQFALFFIVFIIGLEIALRIDGRYKVYSEKTGFWYRSYWGQKKSTWLHLRSPNNDFTVKQKEFQIDYHTNSLGLREKEFSFEKKRGTKRIFCIGDSFTEGDGATYEQTYPKHIEHLIQNHCMDERYEVLNAGVAGSDIIYMQKLIETELFKYQPDAFIVSINSSDIDDITVRGGIDRFRPNGETVFKNGPWYHLIYKASHIVRLIVHVRFDLNEFFLTEENSKTNHIGVINTIDQSIDEIQSFCQAKSIDLFFYISPDVWLANTVQYPSDSLNPIDSPLYFQSFSIFDKLTNLDNRNVVNLTVPMIDTLRKLPFESFSWPINGHFNSNGYRILAEYIFNDILLFKPDYFCGDPTKNKEKTTLTSPKNR